MSTTASTASRLATLQVPAAERLIAVQPIFILGRNGIGNIRATRQKSGAKLFRCTQRAAHGAREMGHIPLGGVVEIDPVAGLLASWVLQVRGW